jgi:hypothetical protein
VAAAQPEALRRGQEITGRSEATLREAAAFFIEQILFGQDSDSYRTLGTSSQAPRSELRRHMGLLMKWLHPDTQEPFISAIGIDRSVFLHRVSKAWDDMKTSERRAEYDRALSEKIRNSTHGHGRPARRSVPPGGQERRRFLADGMGLQSKRGSRPLLIVKVGREMWLRRLLQAWRRA